MYVSGLQVHIATDLANIHTLLHIQTHTTGALVAGIYVTSGWTMTSGVALGWGVGLSLFSMLLNTFVSCGSLYSFM